MESPYRRIYSGDSSRRSLYGRPNSAFRTLSRQASTAASTATLGRVSTPLQTARQTLRLPPPKPSISRAGCSSAVSDFFSEVKKGKHGNDRDKCRQNGHEELQEQEPSKPNYNSEHVQHLGAFAVDKQQSPRVQATHDWIDISVGEQKKGTTAAAGNGMSFGGSGFDLQGKEESAGRKGGEQVPPHMGERKRREDETDCVNRMIPKDETAPGESVPLRSQHQLDQHGAITPHATDCLLSRQPFFTHERSLDSLHSLPLMPHSLSSRTVLRTELSIEKKLGPAAPLCKTKSPRMKTGLAKSEGHLTRTIAPETQAQPATETRTARYKASPPTQPGVHTSQVGTRNTKAKPCNRKMPTYLGSGSRKKARSSSCGLPPERLSRAGLRPGYAGRLSGGRRQQLSRSCQQTPQPQLSPVTPPGAVNLPTNESLNFSPLSASLPPTCSLPSQQVPPFPIDVKALREATASFLRPEGPPLPEPESFNPVSIPVTQYTPKREKLGQNVSVHGDAAPVNTEGLRYSSKHLPPLSEAELATSAASALCATVSPGVSSPDHEVPQKAERKGFTFQSVSTFSDTQSSRLQIQRETKQDVASLKERESRAIPGKGQQRKCREDSPSKNIVLQGLSPRSRSEVKREMKRWFKERSAAASRQGDFFPPQNTGGESHTLSKLTEDLRFHSPEQLVLYYKKQIEALQNEREVYAEQMKKCRLSSEEVQQLRHELLHHQEETRKTQQQVLEKDRLLVEERKMNLNLARQCDDLKLEAERFKRKAELLLNVSKPSVEEVFLHPNAIPSKKYHFYTAPSSHPILAPEENSSSSSSCCTTIQPTPREEAEEERKRRSRLGDTRSSSSHRKVLSLRKKEKNPGGRSIKKGEQQSRLAIIDSPPSCMQRRKKLLSATHLRRSKSITTTITGSTLNAKRRSLSLLHEKKESDEDFLSPNEYHRSISLQGKSRKQRTYLGPSSEPGGVIKVVYLPCEEVKPLTQKLTILEDRLHRQQSAYEDLISLIQNRKLEEEKVRNEHEETTIACTAKVMKELNEKEKQLIDTAERYFHVKHQLTDLQTLHKEETQRTKNLREQLNCLASLLAERRKRMHDEEASNALRRKFRARRGGSSPLLYDRKQRASEDAKKEDLARQEVLKLRKQLEAMERKNKKEVHELRRAAEIARQKLRTVEFRRRCDLEGFSVDALQWRKRMQGLERWSYMLGRLLESRLKLSLSYRDRAVVTREHEELEEALRDLKASMCLSFNPKKEKKEIEKSMKRKESEVSLEIDEREEGDPKPYTKATQVEISPSSSSPPGRSLCRQEEKREGKTRDTSNLQSDSQVDPSPPLPYHLTGEKTSCPSFPLFQREEENNSSSSDAPPDVPSKSSSSSSSFSYPSHSSVTSSSSSSFLRKVSPLQSIYTESPPVATLPSSSSSKEIEGSSIALAQEKESKLHPTIDVPKREGEKNEDVERSTRNAGDRRSPSRALSYPSSSCLFGISLSPQALRSFSHTLPSTISPAGILPAKKDSSCSSSLRPLEKIHSSSSLSNSSSSSSHPPGDVFQTHSHFKTSSSSSSSSTLCLSSSSSSSAYPSETLSPFPLYSPSPCVLLNSSSSSSGPCKDHRCCHVSAGVPYHPSPCPSLLVHPPGGPCSPPPSSSSHVSCVVHSQAASSSLPSFFSRPPCGYKREDVHVDTNTLVTSIQSNLQKKETSLSTTTHEPPFIQSSTFSSSSSSSSFSSSSSSSFSSSSSSSFLSSSSSSFLSSSSSSFSSSALLDCRGPPSSSSSMNVLARESHLSERDLHPLHLHPLFSAPSSSFSVFQNSDPSSSSLSCDSSLCLSQQPKSVSTPVVLYLPSHSSQPLPHAYLEEDEEEKKNEGKKAKEKILPFSTSSTHAKISYQSTHHSHLTTPGRTTDCKPPSRLASSSLLLPSEERGKRQKKAFFFFQQKGEKEERNTNRQNNPTSLLSPKKEIFESPDKKERNPPIYLRHNPSCSSSSSLPSKIAHHLSASSSPCPSPCPPITSATDPSIQLGATLTEGATIDSRRHSPCYPLVAPEEEGSLLSSSSSLNRSSLLPQEKESKSLFFVNQSNPSPPAFMTTQASAMGPSSLSSSSSLTDHFQHPDKRERENKEESNRPSSSSSIPSSSIQQIPRSAEPKGESSASQSLLKGQKERHKEGDRDDKSLSVREISSSRSHERSSSIPLFFNSEEMVSYLPNPPSSSLSYQQHISPSYLPEPSSSESPLPRKALLSQTLSPHAVASSPLPLRGGDFRDEERQREKETKKKEEKEDDRREDREKIESEEEMKRHKIKRREEREIVDSYDKSERPTSLCQSASFLCLSLQEGERKTSRNTFQILPFMSCREREKEESLHGNRSSSSSSADSASHLEIRRHELIANSFHDSMPHREPVLGYDDVFWQKKSQDENTALEGMKKTLPQEGDHRGGEDPKKSVLGCHNRSTHEDLTDPVSAMQSIREWWRQSTQEWKGLPSIQQQEEEEGGEEMREPQPISREQRRGEEDGGEGERSLKGQQGSSLEKSKEGRRKEEEGVTVVNSRASSTSLTSLREDGLKEKKKNNNNSMAIARGEEKKKKKKKKADKEEQDEDDDRQQEKDEEEEETPERRIEKKCERRNYDDKARSSITRKREEESSFASYRQPLCILSTPSKASSHLPLVNFPLPSSLYSVFSTASFSSSSDHHARTKKTNEKEEEEKTQQSLQYGHPSSPVSSSSRCKDFSTKEEKRHFTRDFSQGGTVPSSSFSFFSSSLSQDMTGLQRPLRKEEKGRGEDIGRGGEQERQEGEGENVLVVYDRQQDVSSSKKKRVKKSLSPNRPSSSSHLSPVSSASSSLISPSRRHRTMKICREEAPLNRVAQPPYPLLHSLQFSGKEDYLKDTKKEKEDLHTRSSSDREDKRQKKKKKKTEEVHSTRRGDVGNDEEDEEKKKKEEEEKRRERKVAKDLRDAAHLDELRSKREDEEEECREAPDEGFERELTVETFLSLLQGRKDVCNEENKGKRKTGGSYRERRGSSREGEEEEEEKVMKRQGGRRRHEDKEESHMKYLEGKKKNKIIREMFPQTQSPSSSSYHPYLSTFPSMSHPFSSSSSCFLPFSLWTSSYSPESIHRHLPSAYRDTSYQIHLERSDETTLGRRRRKEENNAAKEEESTTGDEEDGAHAVDDDLISLHALSPSPPSSSSSLLPLSPPGNVLQVSPRSISEDHLSMNEEKRKHRKNEEEEEEEGCSSSRKQRQRGLLLYDGKKWKGLDLLDTHRDRGAAAGEDEERRRRKGEGRGACSSWKSQEEKEEEEEEEKMKKKKEKEKNEVLVSQPKQRNRRTLTRTESHRCMPTYQNRSSSSSSSITLTTTTTT